MMRKHTYTIAMTFMFGLAINSVSAFYEEKKIIKVEERQAIQVLVEEMRSGEITNLVEISKVANKAVQKAERIGSKEDLVTIYSEWGLHYQNNNSLDTALLLHQQALYYAEESGSEDQKNTVYRNLALSHQEKGHLLEGESFYVKSLPTLQSAEAMPPSFHLTPISSTNIFIAAILFSVLAAVFGVYAYIISKNNKRLLQKNEEIEQKNKKLKESNEVLQQFAYVAAHDLKEPLRSIGSFTNLIQRRWGSDFTDEANEYMNYVQTSVKRMNGLLKSLLDYSTLSMQEGTSDTVNSNDILEDVIANLQESILDSGAKVEYNRLPKTKVNALHLTQLFQNLIANSIKYSKSQPHIQISGHQSGDRVHFVLQDNGIGFDKDHGEKVFKLFYQENKMDAEGSGIGLTICKNIIDKYNGSIGFDSKEGVGTTFFFDFPGE